MRIESSVDLNTPRIGQMNPCMGQRSGEALPQAKDGQVRTLGELLERMQAFHAAALGATAACSGKLSTQQMRSPVPHRISLDFEEVGGAVRLREVVEVAALPAPGGPQAVQAIQQQIERNLINWQRRLSPAACEPRPAAADRTPR